MPRLVERFGLTRFDADQNYRLALAAYEKRQLEEAILKMDAAIGLLSNEPEYYAARGLFYLEDGIKDKALRDFEQALRLNRYELLAHYGRGVIAYRDRNWEEALAHFRDAYYADPQRAETVYYLALSYHRLRDNLNAQRFMQAAVTLLENAKDKRRADAQRWVREFQRLVEQAQRQLSSEQATALPRQQTALPLESGES